MLLCILNDIFVFDSCVTRNIAYVKSWRTSNPSRNLRPTRAFGQECVQYSVFDRLNFSFFSPPFVSFSLPFSSPPFPTLTHWSWNLARKFEDWRIFWHCMFLYVLKMLLFPLLFRVPVSAYYDIILPWNPSWHTNLNCQWCVYMLTYCCVNQINMIWYDMIFLKVNYSIFTGWKWLVGLPTFLHFSL